jgi:hypothetical protein
VETKKNSGLKIEDKLVGNEKENETMWRFKRWKREREQ